MYIYKKCNKYKAQGDAQEPVGKPVGGMCMAPAWMSQAPPERAGPPFPPCLVPGFTSYRDITVFLHQFKHVSP